MRMVKDDHFRFTDMITQTKVSRSTLCRMIKDGKIGVKKIGTLKLYSYLDVINNKPRKK